MTLHDIQKFQYDLSCLLILFIQLILIDIFYDLKWSIKFHLDPRPHPWDSQLMGS